jgi:hypothetical protein
MLSATSLEPSDAGDDAYVGVIGLSGFLEKIGKADTQILLTVA